MRGDRRLTRTIYEAFTAVDDSGRTSIRPGDVIDYLRERNQPLGIWLVNSEFVRLSEMGLIELDDANATWHLVPGLAYDDALLS